MKRLLFLLIMLFGWWNAYAQPSNDDPCNAIPLNVGTSCSYTQFTNAAATASANIPAPGCASYSGGDVWFTFVVPASGNIILNSNTGVMTDGGMAIYSGSCNALTLIACDDDGSPNGLMPMISRTGLTPGSTIYVRFWEFSNDNNGTFSLCAYAPIPPANDEPCNAIPLTVGTTCSYSQFSNSSANGSSNVPAPGCAGYSGGDVWFSLVVPPSGNIVINTDTGLVQDGGMAIYSGACNALALIACDDNSSPNGLMPMITRTGLTPGSTIFVRFWEYLNDNNGTFSICAYSPPPISNDNPCNAISLPVTSSCVMTAYSNVGATASSGVPAPGCGNYQGGDVWFSAVVPANGILSINTQTGILLDAAMALYSGTCSALTLIECDDDDGPGSMPGIYRTGLTPGSTVYIRVWDRTNDESGDFSICVKSVNCNSASVNSACVNADPFCTGVNYEYCNTTGVASLGAGGAYGCLGSAPNPSFFYFNAATSGPIDIFMQQTTYTGTPIDVDFILWGPFSSYASMCSGYSASNIIDCSYDPAPQETANIPNAVAGQWYLLLITNYSNQAGIFTFSQTNAGAAGSGSTNCNLITATPGPCSNGLFTVSGTVRFTNAPSSGTLTVTNSCGGSQVFNAPFTSPINYSIPNSCANGGVCSVTGVFSAANAPVLLPATYTAPANCYTFTATPGPCTSGNYVLSGTLLVGCPPPTGTLTITSSCGGSVTYTAPFSSSLNWSLPATPGVGGTCQVSAVFSAAGAPVITPITVTQPACCTPVVPTFTAIGPLCYGATAPTLPTTSNNSIQGTWNPATINTSVAGTSTYTFTPAAGSCASSTTMTVTVNAPPVVYAHGTNPTCANICNGSATVDVVGGTPPYTYTWSNGGSTRTITNLCPGTYTVTVKDASNCSSTTTPVSVAGCFQIQSILVDACSNTEWEQEMVFFQVGTNPLGTSSLSVNWPNASNTWNGLCQNQTFINNTNATITGGGVLIGVPPGGTIPANANVVLITGNTLTVSANSFANLSDTLYVLFQCSGNTAGHFLNYTAGATVRNLIMNFGAGCRDTVSYFPGNLVNTAGAASAANGAYVNYSANGTATYLNYGCVIPFTIPTATVTLTAPPPVNPAFNPIANICQGATAPSLPDSSTNVPSIRGTWSPAAINTTAAGTTTYTFTPAAGVCANTATLTVTINPRVTPSFAPVGPFCANAAIPALSTTSGNGISGTWSPAINASATTNYTFTPSAGQCATSTSLTIVVNPKYTISNNASTCTGSYTLPWGQVVSTAGAYSNTYQSISGCDSIVTVNLSLSTTTQTNLTASICQGQSYVLPWGTSVNTPNTYTNTYSGSGGCDSVVNVSLSVTQLTVPIFNPVSSVCSGASLSSLPNTSTNGITGTWSPGINNTATTTYTFTPSPGQCAASTTLTITIYPNPTVSLQGVNPTCSFNCNGSITANVSGGSSPYTYDWNNGGNTQVISGLCAGVFSVAVSDANGCVSANPASITLTAPLPVAPTFNPIPAICQGSVPPSLPGFSTNVPSISGTWSPSPISTSTTGVSTYTFTPAAGACALTATLDVTIAPPPAKTISISACANKLPYTWQGHVFFAAGSIIDTVPGVNGCDTQRTILFSVNPLLTVTRNISVCANKLPYTWQGHVFTGAGLVIDTVQGINGCDTQRTIILSVNPLLTATRNISVCENRLPFTWQGHVFTAPTTISDTVPGPSGCDTIRTINFTLDPLNTSTRYLSVCANKLPYSWQGHIFTGASTIEDTVAGPSGCDTVRTINFSVNPLFTSTVDLTICSYRLPYTWQGYVFTSDSTIVDTVRRVTGCDTVRTIKLIVNPTPTASYSLVVCANKLPFSWLGHVFTAAGTIRDTVPGIVGGCDTLRTLTLLTTPLFTANVGLSVCANKLPYSWQGHVFTAAGTIKDTVAGVAGGCDTIRTITLSVTPLLTASVSLSVCANKLPFIWQGHVFNAAGTIKDTVPGIVGGCDTIRTITLIVNPLFTATVNLPVCANKFPYSWQGHVYNGVGTYKDTVSGVSGCDTQRTIIVSLTPLLTTTVSLSTCPNNLPYSWQGHVFTAAGTIRDTVPGQIGCDTQRTITLSLTPLQTTTVNLFNCPNAFPFTWQGHVFNGPGTQRDTVPGLSGCDTQRTIILSLLPLQIDTVRLTTCPNSLPYTFQGHVFNAAGTIIDTVPSQSGCDIRRTIILTVTSVINTQVALAVCPSQLPFSWNNQNLSVAGVYTSTLTSSLGCDSIVTLVFSINSITASPDQVICAGGSASLNASGGISYSWSPTTGLSNPNIASPIASPVVTTQYVVTSQVATGNLITNGDFSQGNSGFSSGYAYNSSNGFSEGTYFVGSGVAAWHPGFAPCTDHTSGSGNVMMVNGATTPNVSVFCTTVQVQPNTNYAFSTWLTTFSNPPALLQFSINGNLLGSPFSGSSTLCNWNNFYSIWNSGNATTATICIVNQSTVLSGNDFGLDDISFSALCTDKDTVVVTVNPVYDTTMPRSTCVGVPFSLPWGGTATSANIYSHTYQTGKGCDSIVRIDLAIRNTSSSVTPITVCNYDLPYTWNGLSYSGAITDTVVFTNAAGCDSLAILQLTVKTRTSHVLPVTLCANELPYVWNGLSFTGPAKDTVVFTNAAGCDSLDILDLSVRPISFHTKQVSVCQNDLPYIWNGISFNAPASDTVILINSVGCDSFDILKLNVLSVTAHTNPVSVCQNDLPYVWNGISYSGPAVDTVILTNAAGCDSLDIINLVIKTISAHADTVKICPTDLPYIWNGLSYNGPIVDTVVLTNSVGCDSLAILNLMLKSPSAYTEVVSACESYLWHGTTYYASTNAPTFITTNAAGCDSVITLNLTINRGTHNVFNNSACQTYTWNGVTYTATGVYHFDYQNANGCLSADTLYLTISSGVPTAYKDTACNSYSWNGTVYSQSGNYIYSFSSGSCNVTDTLHLVIHTGTFAGLTTNACDSFLWHGSYYSGSGTFLFNYSNSFGCPSVDTLNLTVNSGTFTNQSPSACDSFIWHGTTYTASGDYGYSYVNSSNCLSADSLHLTINHGTFTVQSLSECLSYSWHGTQYTSTGVYVYPYTNTFGCSSADTLRLSISDGTPAVTQMAVCDSFLWNGTTYTASGDYLHSYSSGACNVTDTLHLTIHSGTFSSVDSNVCRSITWYGSVYTTSGVYYHSYSNGFGCPSADTLHLAVSTGVPVTTIDAACGSYLWNGATYTLSGQYFHTYSGGACQVTDTLRLTIHSGTFTSQHVISCDSYSWFGNTYSTSGVYIHDYLNSFGCNSSDTLHLTVNSGTFTVTNQSACNSYNWNGSTYYVSGTYSYAYTNAAGCASVDTLNLIISTGAPIVSAASACDSYLWNGTTYTQTGTYVYQYPPGSGCLTADTLNLTVRSGTFASESQASCGSYFWNGQNYTQSGIYLHPYVNVTGCPSADTLILRIDPIPPAPTVNSPTVYCQQAAALPLTATAQGTLVWYNLPSGGTGSVTAPVPNTSTIGNAYYYVSQTLGPCEGPRVPLIVRVTAKPVLDIDRDIRLCYATTLDLTALYNTDGLSALWLFNQQVVSDPTAVNTPGVYQLLAVNSAGCKDTATVRLSLQPQLSANAGPDDTTDFYTPYQLQGSGGGSYMWNPGPPLLNNSFVSNPIALLTETTQFILEVQDPIGCKDYDTVIIYVRLGTDFYVPNAFTPNGDGLNDYFSPVPLGGIARLDYFAVYNRFGNLVFQTSDITRRWDGSYAGRPQDPGNFVWVLKGRNRLGEEKFLKGNVILIR